MSQDFDIRARDFGRCLRRHLPKDTRFVLLLIEPDGNGYCVAKLPSDIDIDRSLTDFSAKFNFYELPKLNRIHLI